MLDFILYIGCIAITFVWLTPKEERSTTLGVKQMFYSVLWFVIILMLASNFVAFNIMEIFHAFFLSTTPSLELNFKNCVTIIANTADFCYESVAGADAAILREENSFAGFWYDASLGSQAYQSFDIFNITGMGFFSVELVTSFVIACFCTIGIFFILLLLRPGILIMSVYLYIGLLTVVSLVFIFCPSLFCMFVSFECLLLVSIGLLKLTSKSERIGEAISEMFMWTLFGSFFLLLGFFSLYTEFGNNIEFYTSGVQFGASPTSGIVCLFFLIGFGVKIPTWPFISWLLKAHVEASVEFSILLSGFIVKLGILGLWRILDAFAPDWIYLLVLGVSCLAILDATLRLFTQTDLKRIVALTTVIEMNWLNMCYLLGDVNMVFLAHFLIVAHCFTTASEFLLVEFISKRYNTRDFWQITGLWYNTPVLWYFSFVIVFTTMGFPGTSIFFAKFLFLSAVLSYSVWLFFFFIVIFFLFLPLFFVRLWVPIWFGLNSTGTVSSARSLTVADLTAKEMYVLSFSSGMGILLGVFPTIFFNVF